MSDAGETYHEGPIGWYRTAVAPPLVPDGEGGGGVFSCASTRCAAVASPDLEVESSGSRTAPQRVVASGGFESVSCASPTRCMAVGGTSAEWNGHRWMSDRFQAVRTPSRAAEPPAWPSLLTER